MTGLDAGKYWICILIFLCALSRKPQKARLEEYKHTSKKKEGVKKEHWVSIQLPYDWESCALRAGPERYFLFHVCAEKQTLPLAKKHLFFQISKLTSGGWETYKKHLPLIVYSGRSNAETSSPNTHTVNHCAEDCFTKRKKDCLTELTHDLCCLFIGGDAFTTYKWHWPLYETHFATKTHTSFLGYTQFPCNIETLRYPSRWVSVQQRHITHHGGLPCNKDTLLVTMGFRASKSHYSPWRVSVQQRHIIHHGGFPCIKGTLLVTVGFRATKTHYS